MNILDFCNHVAANTSHEQGTELFQLIVTRIADGTWTGSYNTKDPRAMAIMHDINVWLVANFPSITITGLYQHDRFDAVITVDNMEHPHAVRLANLKKALAEYACSHIMDSVTCGNTDEVDNDYMVLGMARRAMSMLEMLYLDSGTLDHIAKALCTFDMFGPSQMEEMGFSSRTTTID